MALPLIPLAIGGAIGAGGTLLGSLFSRGQQDDRELSSFDYSPTDIYTYSPTDARQTIDARQDARSFVYQPVLQIDSPGATATPTTTIEQELENRARQDQQVTPDIYIAPSQERTISQDTGGTGISNQTLIIGAVVLGAVLLVPQLMK